MPGDTIDVPTNLTDQQVIAEGWRHSDWPAPQFTEVKNGSMTATLGNQDIATTTPLPDSETIDNIRIREARDDINSRTQ